MKKYGIEFGDENDCSIELWCYKNQEAIASFNGDLKGEAYHLERAMRLLWSDEQLTWCRESYDMLNLWCQEDFMTILGAASTGKSNFMGAIAVADFLSAPKDTAIYVCSTDIEMLQVRIWEAIQRYMGYHIRSLPFKFIKRPLLLINTDDDLGEDADYSGVKKAIRGVAVGQGEEQAKASKLIGGHLPYVRLILDEMQETPPAAFAARHNLSKGCKQFKFVGIGNPSSWDDMLMKASEPLDGNFHPTADDQYWKTKYGACVHLDGLKSSAIMEPDGEKKYHFLIKQSEIDRDYPTEEDRNTPYFYQYVRGFPPPDGISNTVLTRNIIKKHSADQGVDFSYGWTMIGGLDPAFTSGGDGCILTPAKVGTFNNGVFGIQFLPPIEIKLVVDSEEPVSYYIARRVREIAQDIGLDLNYLGVDESGTQRLGDVIDKECGCRVHRVNFGGRASGLLVSKNDPRKGFEVYGNRVTELWYTVRQLVMYNQMRGLGHIAIDEFCTRRIIKSKPYMVESKSEMKKRTRGKSPDYADSAAICIDTARVKKGFVVGKGVASSKNTKKYKKYDFYKESNMYQTDEWGRKLQHA